MTIPIAKRRNIKRTLDIGRVQKKSLISTIAAFCIEKITIRHIRIKPAINLIFIMLLLLAPENQRGTLAGICRQVSSDPRITQLTKKRVSGRIRRSLNLIRQFAVNTSKGVATGVVVSAIIELASHPGFHLVVRDAIEKLAQGLI